MKFKELSPFEAVLIDGPCGDFSAEVEAELRAKGRFDSYSGYPRIVVVADKAPKDMESFEAPLDPQGVIERSKRIIEAYQLKEPLELTVGDLSVVSKEKRKRDAMHPRADAQKRGLTVGSLYEGPEIPQPSVSESQALTMEMQAKFREKRQTAHQIQQVMFEQQSK